MRRPRIPNPAARRLFLDRHALLAREGGPGRGADLAGLVEGLGFVQLDSVNTLARAQDLILWSRRQRFRPEALDRLHGTDRRLWEHWTHDAALIPVAFYPHWRHRFALNRARFAARWEGWQGREFLARTDEVLRRIADGGPVTSGELTGDTPRPSGGWWDWHPSKAALEYLWHTGDLAIARREGFRKVYDLAERVIPAEARATAPEREESLDWAMRGALDRLGVATGGELAAFWALFGPEEAKVWCQAALDRGEIEEVEIEGADGRWRRALARPGTAVAAAALPPPAERVRVLSPFDPMLRDRARAERLFGFHYRIEIFVPAPQRRYGYYVFPVWEGDRAIGRIDMKRDGTRLAVRAFWPEAGIAMGRGRLSRLMAELDRVAAFAGLAAIDLAPDWLRH